MVAFSRVLTSLLLAIAYTSVAQASHPHTHRRRVVGKRGLELDTYHPEVSYEIFGEGIEQPPSFIGGLEEDTVGFVQSKLGVDGQDVGYKSGYETGEETRFGYVRQLHGGIPFANAVANVGWRGTRIVSFGSSFVKPSNIADSRPTFDVNEAIKVAEEALDGKFNGQTPTIEYLARPDGTAALTHAIQIRNEAEDLWYEAFVDAHSGELLSVTDFVSDAAYTVLPIWKQAFPEGQEVLVDPQDPVASPFGWHNTGSANTTNTSGNNVIAFKGSQATGTVYQSSPGLVFDYRYDDTLEPAAPSNVNASVVNAFYIINTVHDFAYRYGFTEIAYNFQAYNFENGGAQNDRVIISVQDSSGINNANFATPPDGQSGVCRMYIWTYTSPRRDGSMENDIIVHEMTHGITNRMTGGGTGRCLQTIEAGGLGEGWSDAMAEWTEHKSAVVKDYVTGVYVTNNPAGIRTRPYSTSRTVNPLTYADIRNLTSVHRIGEVWANMLHNVYAALVAEHGWSPYARINPDGYEGNIIFLHLFIDALALQPCNPTFVSARAAWIQADQNRYYGVNRCLLWKAFASRGLGVNAANYVNDFTVPADCA